MDKHGQILGIPYDFRIPTPSRIKERVWNPDDPRIFTPHVFGIGWTINLPSLRERSKPGFYVAVALYAIMFVNMIRSLYRGARRLKGLLSRKKPDS